MTVEETIKFLGAALIGGAASGLISWGAIRQTVKDHGRRISKLERLRRNLDDRFVTRREFQIVMESIRDDLKEISENVGEVRKFLMQTTHLPTKGEEP